MVGILKTKRLKMKKTTTPTMKIKTVDMALTRKGVARAIRSK